ncbi:MAG: bifunctional riboflavin kinase/FAD synthetase [Suilimivivens sp.]
MQIIEGTAEFQMEGRNAIAIGKFDGIHRGHIELLKHILAKKALGLKTVVFTFDPPASVFFGRAGEKELSPLSEKRRFFEGLGIDVLVEFPLNKETAATPAEDFIEKILVSRMHAAYIAAGSDLSFGYKGRGNKELLMEQSEKFGYQVEIITKVMEGEREISSSYVREEVEAGNMEMAARLLGRNYSVTGIVESGRKLGRRLGMPTLNLYPPKDKLLPPSGVYFSRVLCGEEIYNGITNIGNKPTVNDTPRISVETYLYDFEGNLYGREIETQLLHFRRPEYKFAGVEVLKKQMEEDIAAGRLYHCHELPCHKFPADTV